MSEDASHTVAAPLDHPVPGSVRVAAWTFLLASAAGFVGGILELAAAARTGALSISVPLAVGVTGLALFRALGRPAARRHFGQTPGPPVGPPIRPPAGRTP